MIASKVNLELGIYNYPTLTSDLSGIDSRFVSAQNISIPGSSKNIKDGHGPLAEFTVLQSKFGSQQKIIKRSDSAAVSDRLINGWRDISYVRKMSVDRDKHAPKAGSVDKQPPLQMVSSRSNPKPAPKLVFVKHSSMDNLNVKPPKHIDLRQPWEDNLTDSIRPPVVKAPKIYDRGLNFIEKREEKLSTIKKKFGGSFRPRLIESAVAPKMAEPWQKYKSAEDARRNQRPQIDVKKQKKLQEQYERNIAGKVEDFNKKPSHVSRGSEVNIADRQAEWVRRKEERLEEIRRGKADYELEKCTFKPKINKGYIAWN